MAQSPVYHRARRCRLVSQTFYDFTTTDGAMLAAVGHEGFGSSPRIYLFPNPFGV